MHILSILFTGFYWCITLPTILGIFTSVLLVHKHCMSTFSLTSYAQLHISEQNPPWNQYAFTNTVLVKYTPVSSEPWRVSMNWCGMHANCNLIIAVYDVQSALSKWQKPLVSLLALGSSPRHIKLVCPCFSSITKMGWWNHYEEESLVTVQYHSTKIKKKNNIYTHI